MALEALRFEHIKKNRTWFRIEHVFPELHPLLSKLKCLKQPLTMAEGERTPLPLQPQEQFWCDLGVRWAALSFSCYSCSAAPPQTTFYIAGENSSDCRTPGERIRGSTQNLRNDLTKDGSQHHPAASPAWKSCRKRRWEPTAPYSFMILYYSLRNHMPAGSGLVPSIHSPTMTQHAMGQMVHKERLYRGRSKNQTLCLLCTPLY